MGEHRAEDVKDWLGKYLQECHFVVLALTVINVRCGGLERIWNNCRIAPNLEPSEYQALVAFESKSAADRACDCQILFGAGMFHEPPRTFPHSPVTTVRMVYTPPSDGVNRLLSEMLNLPMLQIDGGVVDLYLFFWADNWCACTV